VSRQFIETLDLRRVMSTLGGNVNLDEFTQLSNAFWQFPIDYNLDRKLDLTDVTSFMSLYSSTNNGDFDSDDIVNAADFTFIRDNKFKFVGGEAIAASAGFGDANMDGRIDTFDFRAIANSFNRENISVQERWSSGDFTLNGRVTIKDFTLAALNFASRD